MRSHCVTEKYTPIRFWDYYYRYAYDLLEQSVYVYLCTWNITWTMVSLEARIIISIRLFFWNNFRVHTRAAKNITVTDYYRTKIVNSFFMSPRIIVVTSTRSYNTLRPPSHHHWSPSPFTGSIHARIRRLIHYRLIVYRFFFLLFSTLIRMLLRNQYSSDEK